MPYSIRKSFTFAASHILCGLPEGHPCGRLHGHNYRVTLELSGPDEALSPVGFLRDYRDLDGFKALIAAKLDHRHLNDWSALTDWATRADEPPDAPRDNPTAERLAYALYQVAQDMYPGEVAAVAVEETENTWAEYRPYRPPTRRGTPRTRITDPPTPAPRP